MSRNIDPEMLNELLTKLQNIIPDVKSGIERYCVNPEQQRELENSYQSIHEIIDISAMLELPILYHIADFIATMMEQIAVDSNFEDSNLQYIFELINLLENYLSNIQNKNQQYLEEIVENTVKCYRRFANLPIEEDNQTINLIMSELSNDGRPLTTDRNYGEGSYQKLGSDLKDQYDAGLDFESELLEGFLVESEDYLDTIGSLLPGINENTYQNNELQQIRRSVHTLKGAAGIVGFHSVSQLAHRMEDILDELYDGHLRINSQIKDVMLSTFDVLEDYLRDKKGQGDIEIAAQNLNVIYDDILGSNSRSISEINHDDNPDTINESCNEIGHGNTNFGHSFQDTISTVNSEDEIVKESLQQTEFVRVPIDRLDEIMRLFGEIVIGRSVFEQNLANLLYRVDELYLSIDRLQKTSGTIETQYEVSALVGSRSQTTHGKGIELSRSGEDWSGIIEFDDLEFDRYSDFHLMSRDLSETSADIGALGIELRDIISDFDAYLTRQTRLTSEIQDKLMHFRMVPLASLSTRLHRAVRVTAKQLNKEVNLQIEGEEVQFDKTMLDELNEALLHILRNAVDHGIEFPSIRKQMGKPSQGLICLRAFREGTQIVIEIQDDGSGLDPVRLRNKAIQNSLISEQELDSWTDDQVYSLIFAPGFSTATEINEVSGRGVGMDIVSQIMVKLKGRIAIESSQGDGTTLTIRLPVNLALTHVLLTQVNNQVFAIPVADVIQVLHIEIEAVETISEMRVVSLNHKVTPLIFLADVLNMAPSQPFNQDRFPIIVVQTGSSQIALVVDQLLGGREVVVKTLGAHLHRVRGLIGSTLMGDGSIVLILNINELVNENKSSRIAKPIIEKTSLARVTDIIEILIVDDSFSVRRVIANLVKKAGWRPILAKNGLEALEIIQHSTSLPDLILLDVEMPQMDGYELTSTLRTKEIYQTLPIVMLTSRAGDKHRQKAFEVGATEYVVKPYRDTALLNLINRLVSESRANTVASLPS